MKLLVVEDEKDLLESIIVLLQKQGYVAEGVSTCFSAEDKLSVYDYDLVILDLTLPDGNGLELIKELKSNNPETCILIVSAKDSLDDKIVGLDLGADDYLTKPFHLAELNSRVNAIIRRKFYRGKEKIIINDMEIETSNKQVSVKNQVLDLTKKEYELLLYLVINKNRVLTKEAIAEHLWGDNISMADNFDFIYTHIKNLRKKIVISGGGNFLKSVYGLGYKLTEQ